MERLPEEERIPLTPRQWRQIAHLMHADPAQISRFQGAADSQEYLAIVQYELERHPDQH